MSSSASAHAGDIIGAMPLRVGLEIRDPGLECKVRAVLARQTDMSVTAMSDAAVVITDDPLLAAPAHALVLSNEGTGANVLRLADAEMVAAAARMVAAGYAITHSGPAPEDQLVRYGLTSREREVALLLLDGRSNKAIARALDISVHTAKFHVAALLTKLRARNRADAVAIILREGLVPV
jgi:DNA-binding CsgD family transcriptional regulator